MSFRSRSCDNFDRYDQASGVRTMNVFAQSREWDVRMLPRGGCRTNLVFLKETAKFPTRHSQISHVPGKGILEVFI
jgi:hypothetical protein